MGYEFIVSWIKWGRGGLEFECIVNESGIGGCRVNCEYVCPIRISICL